MKTHPTFNGRPVPGTIGCLASIKKRVILSRSSCTFYYHKLPTSGNDRVSWIHVGAQDQPRNVLEKHFSLNNKKQDLPTAEIDTCICLSSGSVQNKLYVSKGQNNTRLPSLRMSCLYISVARAFPATPLFRILWMINCENQYHITLNLILH